MKLETVFTWTDRAAAIPPKGSHMIGWLLFGGLILLIVGCAIVGARRGTEQTTVFGDPETERQRARTSGTGSYGN